MMFQILDILSISVKACVGWFGALVDSMDAHMFILAVFVFVTFCVLVIKPVMSGKVSSFGLNDDFKASQKYRNNLSSSYTKNKIHKSKIQKNKGD